MDEKIPKQLQDKLAQFQNLQQQLQMLSMQKQQMVLQNGEIENAQKELEGAKSDGKVYRIVGPILVESSKADMTKKLKDDFDLNKTRVDVLEKQEKKFAEKLNEMRSELQTMIKGSGQT
jgi:prefoldin beta subunit